MIHDPFLDPPRHRRPGCATVAASFAVALVPAVLWPTGTALVLLALLAGSVAASAVLVGAGRSRSARARRDLFAFLDSGRHDRGTP